MPSGSPGTYDQLVATSALRYRQQLDELKSKDGHPLYIEAISRIRALFEDTPKWELRPHHIERLTCTEKLSLLNPFSLGLGAPSAKIVSVGTEHAYDMCSVENLVLEGYSLSALTLHDVGVDVVARLADHKGWEGTKRRAFHLHPTDYYSIPSGHTWNKLAKVLSGSGVLAYRGTTKTNLCDRVYQIELSHLPAKRVAEGAATNALRRSFLVAAFKVLASCGAQAVLIHGKSADEAARDAIVTAFLGAVSIEAAELPVVEI